MSRCHRIVTHVTHLVAVCVQVFRVLLVDARLLKIAGYGDVSTRHRTFRIMLKLKSGSSGIDATYRFEAICDTPSKVLCASLLNLGRAFRSIFDLASALARILPCCTSARV